jgi:hypothetical protein
MAREHGYLLDNKQAEAGARFDALAALFDPWTFRHIDDLGIGDGWRCREVGAGGAIDCHLANVAAGRLDLATSPMVSAWGRRPAPN